MLRRAGVPVPISDSEFRAMVVRPVPVEPKRFSEAELEAWTDACYAAEPEPPTPPATIAVLIPIFWIGYGALRGVAALLKLGLRGLRAINRQCDEADDRITLFGMLLVLSCLVVARYAVYVAAFYLGGAQ